MYDGSSFAEDCLSVFRYQYANCAEYREYSRLLGVESPDTVTGIDGIPFLPVRFFKQYKIVSEGRRKISGDPVVFSSSSTTGQIPSRHYVLDRTVYERSFLDCFRMFYGQPDTYVILALLPSYLEREGSSLVYMAERLIRETSDPLSGFYLYDYGRLYSLLQDLGRQGRKTLLLGVAFALMDFADKYSLPGPNDSWLTVMETGGMKGRREEISRDAMHGKLRKGFSVSSIHSEYGMCELLSQAYSAGNGIFRTPPWMKIIVRDIHDPLISLPEGKQGIIDIVDLANINSCSFIETEDIGRLLPDGSFTVDGRLSGAERRGCNMLIE